MALSAWGCVCACTGGSCARCRNWQGPLWHFKDRPFADGGHSADISAARVSWRDIGIFWAYVGAVCIMHLSSEWGIL